MKKGILLLGVMLLLMFGVIGCEGFLLGAGAGVAGQETLQAWEENLEAKKLELQKKYDAVMAEIESAPDPNALALAKKKLEPIQDQQLVNEAALFSVKQIMKLPETSGGKEGRTDVLITTLIGGGIVALREWQKRQLNKKYISMKAGKANFEIADPEAAKKLHVAIGKERHYRGLY